MMKKFWVGFILLVLLGGLIFVQVMRDREKKAAAFLDGHEVGRKSAELSQPNVDSVATLLQAERDKLARLETVLDSSLAGQDSVYQSVTDSLNGLIDDQRAELSGLKKKLSATASKPKTKTVRKVSGSSTTATSQVLDHYELAVAKLPADLSPYEHQVAIAEVRNETAEKFKITLQRLNQIRQENNLDF